MPANSSRNKFGGYKPKATSVASSSAHRSSGFADPNNKKASQSRHRVSAWKQVRENEAQPRPTASSQDKIIPGSSNSNTTDVVDQASAVLEYNELIQLRIVLPGKHMIPERLRDPSALQPIADKYAVQISQPQPNIIHVQAKAIQPLQQALREINWAVHDFRRSNEPLDGRYVVQPPLRTTKEALVTVEVGQRPNIDKVASSTATTAIASAVDFYKEALVGALTPATEAVRSLDKDVRMRAYFGQTRINQRKKGMAEHVSYPEFRTMMKQLSRREGVHLETRLPDSQFGRKEAKQLLDQLRDYSLEGTDIRHTCNLTLFLSDHEVVMDVTGFSEGATNFSDPRAIKSENSPRLNWVMPSPDMAYDWGIRVEAIHDASHSLEVAQALKNMCSLSMDGKARSVLGKAIISPPKLSVRPGSVKLKELVDKMRLETSTLIPYQDTAYIIEINICQTWDGFNTSTSPDTTWTIQFYNPNWDILLNTIHPDGRGKDWGDDLSAIWPGAEETLKHRFGEFVRHILNIQATLSDPEDVVGACCHDPSDLLSFQRSNDS